MAPKLARSFCLVRCQDLQLDRVGAALACGGLCATARDWARFGLCIAHDGLSQTGEQLLPAAFVRGSRTSEAQRATVSEFYGGSSRHGLVTSYHNKLWIFGESQETWCVSRARLN
jgi:CubicO group peptidase (beta-lactamase class C family)